MAYRKLTKEEYLRLSERPPKTRERTFQRFSRQEVDQAIVEFAEAGREDLAKKLAVNTAFMRNTED